MKQALTGAFVFVLFAVMSWGSWVWYNQTRCAEAGAYIKQIELCNQHKGCIFSIDLEDAGAYINAMATKDACSKPMVKIVEILKR